MGKKAILLLSSLIFWVATLVVAALAFVAWLAGRIPPSSSWFVAMIAIGITPILAANLLFCIVWAIKRSWWALLPLAAVLLNYSYITSIFNFNLFQDKSAVRSELKLMTYNIHGYGNKDFRAFATEILDYADSQGIDVVCMQEYWQPKDDADTLTHGSFANRVVVSPYPGMQLALWSKFPIVDSRFLWFGAGTANGAMVADLDVEGRDVRIVSVHLQTTNINQSKEEIAMIRDIGIEDPEGQQTFDLVMKRLSNNAVRRTQQVVLVRKYIEPYLDKPLIVCGDFNDVPSSYTYRKMAQGLREAFDDSGQGYVYTMSGMMGLFKVDYILHSPMLEAVDCVSQKLTWSDHYPLIAEFVFAKK